MNKITMDAELERKISTANGDTALIDRSGVVKAYVISPTMKQVLDNLIELPYSEEEIEEIIKNPSGYSSEEVDRWMRDLVANYRHAT